ncbi:hypothetical protein NESM_000762600 [Novymonas esmeraldas]|uniref:Uncharacterized protein n=1 Tax=Novymonas esmeraldas TaxID=1808958 RepID=A0AAW0EWF1_9TRYP
MPLIQSRVHADALQAATDALAAANHEVDAMRHRALGQSTKLDEQLRQNADLTVQLAQTQSKLDEARRLLAATASDAEAREERHRTHVSRLEASRQTVEDMLQAARHREREAQRRSHTTPSHGDSEAQDTRRSPLSTSSAAVATQPPSAQVLYEQDQLLRLSQCAAANLDEVQRRLRSCVPSSGPQACVEAGAWASQLEDLKARFDDVVQADAKLISFLILVAEQQSQQLRTLEARWVEAQRTVREADAVLDDAAARVATSAQESAMLREECAALTQMQATLQAQLSERTREHDAATGALQRLQTAQTELVNARVRQEAQWTARLTQAAEAQLRATAYAETLEAALLEKERLMSSAAATSERRHRRAAVEAAQERVAAFVQRLRASAELLQGELGGLADTPLPLTHEKTAYLHTSPEPSPPGASTSASHPRTHSPSPSLPSPETHVLRSMQPTAAAAAVPTATTQPSLRRLSPPQVVEAGPSHPSVWP